MDIDMDKAKPVSEEPKYEIFYQDGRLVKEFSIPENPQLGMGGFGTVIQAQHKIDLKCYAIKKIYLEAKSEYSKKIRELQVWAHLDCDHFVQYRSSWVERGPENLITLHIQMDLCWFDLQETIRLCRIHFDTGDKHLFPRLGYYVLSELLLEIVESIDFLHKSKPQIIHRDIKPPNVLIRGHGRDGRFVKLSDFGLAVTHERESQTHSEGTGTDRYMAPEVRTSRHYKPSADLYSLGVMIQEMFHIDINRPIGIDFPQYQKLKDITALLLSVQSKARPNCSEIISGKNAWYIHFQEVGHEIEASVLIDQNYDHNKHFVQCFFKNKLSSYRQHNI